jgi:hypothetical protein
VVVETFAGEEIQRKAREDLEWIKENAVVHARVVQEAMGKDHVLLDLIPMKFGTIFKDRARLEEVLEKDYLRIREVLERIRGKQEWSVKVYLKDRKKFEEKIKEKNGAIKEKAKEISSLPEGIAYFMEEALKEIISEEVDKELNFIIAHIYENINKHAVDVVRCKILGKELMGRIEPMVLNAAYLLKEEKIEDFKNEVKELNDGIQEMGLYIEYSGPWPPYNFTPVERLDNKAKYD